MSHGSKEMLTAYQPYQVKKTDKTFFVCVPEQFIEPVLEHQEDDNFLKSEIKTFIPLNLSKQETDFLNTLPRKILEVLHEFLANAKVIAINTYNLSNLAKISIVDNILDNVRSNQGDVSRKADGWPWDTRKTQFCEKYKISEDLANLFDDYLTTIKPKHKSCFK